MRRTRLGGEGRQGAAKPVVGVRRSFLATAAPGRGGLVKHLPAIVAVIAGAALLGSLPGCGDGGSGGGTNFPAGSTSWVHHWNEIAINASGLDHTPPAPGETRVYKQQFGPTRASRAIAIVHIAIYDAVNAIVGGAQSYTNLPRAPEGTSMKAAIAQSAHDTLVALFSAQTTSFDEQLATDLAAIEDGQAKSDGIALGQQAAAAILAMRANDGSDHPEPVVGVDYIPGDGPGIWRPDPISKGTIALGALWSEVRPFSMTSAEQFRVPQPPALESPEYAAAYNDVKSIGGDGVVTPTVRTEDQTETGIFWAYDGTPNLCAPPRLYNQMIATIADLEGSNVVQLARLLALANVAMADAGIAIWESKFYYKYWRPVTGIREADAGTGPTGQGDNNPETEGDPNFTPLGAPLSNGSGPNFTPPFPSYPSGHAGFGGALFGVLRRFYGRDDVPFTFVSDELNGITLDNKGQVRPRLPRSFSTFTQAEEENGQSRIYLGIHWKFDKDQGIAQGEQIADWVMQNTFVPAR